MSDTFDADDIDPTESPMLDALRSASASEAPPGGMDERSELLLGWLDVDEQLGRLLSDVDVEPAGVRSDMDVVGELAMSDGTPVVEWRVDGSSISGLVMADSITAVEVQRANGEVRHASLTDLGRFTLDDVVNGPVRLRLLFDDGRIELTPWFVV